MSTYFGHVVWCQEITSHSTSTRTKGMIVDFRKQQREHPHIEGIAVEKVESFKFLGVHITDKMFHPHRVVKKAQQRLFNLRRLKKFGLASKTLKLLQMHH